MLAGHRDRGEAALLVESGWAGRHRADNQRRASATFPPCGQPATTMLSRRTKPRAQHGCRRWPGGLPLTGSNTVGLVQVPRRGYQPGLACAACRTPARCTGCGSPLSRRAQDSRRCRWCGVVATAWRCGMCGKRLAACGRGRRAADRGGARARVSRRDRPDLRWWCRHRPGRRPPCPGDRDTRRRADRR